MLASVIAVIHILVMVWLCVGVFLALRFKCLAWPHWLSMMATLVLRAMYGDCPLTIWQREAQAAAPAQTAADAIVPVQVIHDWLGVHLSVAQTNTGLWLVFALSTLIVLSRLRFRGAQRR